MVRRWRLRAYIQTLAADHDNKYMMLASTNVRAHQHSAGAQTGKKGGQAIGRSRGGLTTKIHVIANSLGNPIAISLTPGQTSDLAQAEPLLAEVDPQAFLADKAYNADALIDHLKERHIIQRSRRKPIASGLGQQTSRFIASATSSNGSSIISNNSEHLQLDMTSSPVPSSEPFSSSPRSFRSTDGTP